MTVSMRQNQPFEDSIPISGYQTATRAGPRPTLELGTTAHIAFRAFESQAADLVDLRA
jgi:hypothetical protein